MNSGKQPIRQRIAGSLRQRRARHGESVVGSGWPSFGLQVALVASAFLYSPLSLWSAYVGEASLPRLLLLGAIGALIGSGLVWLARTERLRLEVTAALVPLALVFSFSGRWQPFEHPVYSMWWYAGFVGAVFLGWMLLRTMLRSDLRGVVGAMIIATFGIGPLATGAIRAFTERPTDEVRLGTTLESNRRDLGPDVILVILDGYASSGTLLREFSFDNTRLEAALADAGFRVFSGANANYTMSHVSIASLLEMEYVVEGEVFVGPGEVERLYRSIRGDNAFVQSLKAAGYEYVHWESGWTGSLCGPAVDRCLRGVFDEEGWAVLQRSAVGPLLNRWFGSGFTQNALRQLRSLPDVTRSLLEDGKPTLFVAHIIAPHPPVVLESNCEVRQENRVNTHVMAEPGDAMDTTDRARYGEQVDCVNSLLEPFLAEVGSRDDAMVVITGDHGTDSDGQSLLYYAAWTQEQVEERLGVLHAVKAPPSCPQQESNDVVLVNSLRGVLRCVLQADVDELPARFFIAPPINVVPPAPVAEIIADSAGRWAAVGR